MGTQLLVPDNEAWGSTGAQDSTLGFAVTSQRLSLMVTICMQLCSYFFHSHSCLSKTASVVILCLYEEALCSKHPYE
jgi:hypothetical protein